MPGRNHLFVPGPPDIPGRTRRAIDVAPEDHRAPTCPGFLLPLLADIKTMFRTERGHVTIVSASGTGGWEAAVTNRCSRARCLMP
jgi:alanine-glyoxylate transaminase/serine-glyoxylate transaminase/serine-pyruvate transaminase